MKIESNWIWASHRPLVLAVIDVYRPSFVLELGIGDFSTPLFQNKEFDYLGVESDPEWIERISEKYPYAEIIRHDIGRIKRGTLYDELTPGEIAAAAEYYQNISIPDDPSKLLFSDQDASTRVISINELRDKFGMILYHDCEPAVISTYRLDLINRTGFNRYYLKTPLAWTGFMIRASEDLGFEALNTAIIPHIDQFTAEYGISGLELIPDSGNTR